MKHSGCSGFSHLLAAFLLVGLLFAGCGGDDNGGEPDLIAISDFEGSWVMQQYKATSVANPAISLELISLGGAFAFDLDEVGALLGRGFVPATFTGTAVELPVIGNLVLISQDTVVVNFTPEMPPFLTKTRAAFTLTSNMVTLYGPDARFDFDGDQVLEPSIFEGTMVKNDGSYPPIIFTEDFEGHWEATGYTVISEADPPDTINTIALGATFEFDVDASGVAVGNAFIPADLAGEDLTFTDFPAAFQLIYQDTMMIAFTPEIPPLLTNTRGHFTLVGDDYTLTDENAMFDFDGDQVLEAAVAVVVMERTSGGK